MNHEQGGGSLLQSFKAFLVWLGKLLPNAIVHQIFITANYIALGHWIRQRGFWLAKRERTRWDVCDVVVQQVKDQRVLYLEFGVFTGGSMRYWSQQLKHPEAKLHGFDSFEGLPEDFDVVGSLRKGDFTQAGVLPNIPDSRVQFFKGWFEDTLPNYTPPEHDILVVTMDADLYSSTKTVLKFLRPHVQPGTFIYFDNMGHIEHEPRAFGEFLEETGLKFEVVSAENSYKTLFFRCTS